MCASAADRSRRGRSFQRMKPSTRSRSSQVRLGISKSITSSSARSVSPARPPDRGRAQQSRDRRARSVPTARRLRLPVRCSFTLRQGDRAEAKMRQRLIPVDTGTAPGRPPRDTRLIRSSARHRRDRPPNSCSMLDRRTSSAAIRRPIPGNRSTPIPNRSKSRPGH